MCHELERICGTQAADPAVQEVPLTTFPTAPAVEAQRTHAYERMTEHIRRAQDDRSMRTDFVPDDIVLILMVNAGAVRGAQVGSGCLATLPWHPPGRAARVCGVRALALPPPPAQTYRAMLQIGRRQNPAASWLSYSTAIPTKTGAAAEATAPVLNRPNTNTNLRPDALDPAQPQQAEFGHVGLPLAERNTTTTGRRAHRRLLGPSIDRLRETQFAAIEKSISATTRELTIKGM